MGFNPDRVTTGIAKLQTAHRKKSQKRMDRYFNLFYFIFRFISLNFILFYFIFPFFLFFIFSLSFLIASFAYHFLLLIWHKILKVYLLQSFLFFTSHFFPFFLFFFFFSFFPSYHFSIFQIVFLVFSPHLVFQHRAHQSNEKQTMQLEKGKQAIKKERKQL